VTTGSAPPSTRTVRISPARVRRWVEGFSRRHGEVHGTVGAAGLALRADDGSTALLVPVLSALMPALMPAGPRDDLETWLAHLSTPVTRDRGLAVVLVRRGGFAVALVEDGIVAASRCGTRRVQGRTAAGGWSQQRFARRRAKQADELLAAAGALAARILVPVIPRAQALVTAGDRSLVAEVLRAPAVAAVAALPAVGHLALPDPRPAVVRALPEDLAAIRVVLAESGALSRRPPGPPGPPRADRRAGPSG
jgi:hypothetical protein